MANQIRVWNGTDAKDYDLEQFRKLRITVGSDPGCDIHVKSDKVDLFQGCFYYDNGAWCFQDLAGGVDVFLDGKQINEVKIAKGNVLVFGEVKGTETVCVEVLSVDASATAAQPRSTQPSGSQAATGAAAGAATGAAIGASAGAEQGAYGQAGRQGGYGQPNMYDQQTQGTRQTGLQPNMYGQSSQGTRQTGMQQNMYGQSSQGTRQTGQQQNMYGQQTRPQQNAYGQSQGTRQSGFGPIPQTSQSSQTPRQGNSGIGQPQHQISPGVGGVGGSGGNGGGSKKGLIIGLVSFAVAAIVTVVILFATGVFGGKKEEGTTSAIGKITESTSIAATTEKASTEKPTEAVTTETPTTEDATEKELESEEIYKIAQQSTVEVQAGGAMYGSLGTGFFDDDKGTVITNYHVINGMTQGIIVTAEGNEYNITKVLGYDVDLDIAILATDIGTSVPLVRREDKVRTGEKVYALGSSQGYSGTFTDGVVSTAERMEDGKRYIQHSAPITNGNSGGPLLDEYARVVGINDWGRIDGQNLNFAIPIDVVDQVSRTSSMTMAQVNEKENGSSGGSSQISGKTGDTITLDTLSSGTELTVELPKEMQYDSAENNIKYVNEEGNIYLQVTGQLEMGYNGATLEDISQEILKKFDQVVDMAKEQGITLEDVQSTTLTINGVTWYAYSTYGYYAEDNENYVVDLTYLVGMNDQGELAAIQMLTLFENDDVMEKNYDTILELEELVMTKVKF